MSLSLQNLLAWSRGGAQQPRLQPAVFLPLSCLGGSATTALSISSHWWVPDLALSPQTLPFAPALASGNSLNYTFFSSPPQLLHPGLGEGRGEQKEGIRGGKLNEEHCGLSCWLQHNCSLQHEFKQQDPWPSVFSAGAAAEGWILGLPPPLSFSSCSGRLKV